MTAMCQLNVNYDAEQCSFLFWEPCWKCIIKTNWGLCNNITFVFVDLCYQALLTNGQNELPACYTKKITVQRLLCMERRTVHMWVNQAQEFAFLEIDGEEIIHI